VIARLAVTSAALALATVLPVAAQGNSGNHKSKPPNRNRLLTRGAGTNATTPIALVDDASLLEPGGMSLTLSIMKWQGSGTSEVDAPIVSAAVGLTPRVQFTATIPYVVGSTDPNGATGGLGTVFLSSKIGLFTNADLGVKLAASPIVAVLSKDTVALMAPGSSRAQLGLPLSAEVGHGRVSVYASVGYYSNGSWFAGAGGSLQAATKISLFLGFSHAWTNASNTDSTLVASERNEASFGVSRAIASRVWAYGSIGRTIGTLDENGAGTTLAAGLSLFLPSGTLTR